MADVAAALGEIAFDYDRQADRIDKAEASRTYQVHIGPFALAKQARPV